MENSTVPDHEKLFDEICGKLSELSHNPSDHYQQRLEAMQTQIKKSQAELKIAQMEIEEKIKSFDNLNLGSNDLSNELKRGSDLLEQERLNNSKLSTELARALELNLKLQFELEENRSRAAMAFNEERKLNQKLTEKNQILSNDLDLAQALCNETRLELTKAKDKFQQEIENLLKENNELENLAEEQSSQGLRQQENLKNLSSVAEKKLIELKLALDKKSAESQDYYSHLQQAMTQINVLRQENTALREYIAKLTALHQNKAQSV